MTGGFAVGWRQVGACMVLMASGSMLTSGYSVVAVPIGHEFATSRTELMLPVTIMALVSGLISPSFGNLMDRASLRRLMLLGAACLVTGFVALSFATSFLHIMIIYAVLMAPGNTITGPMSAAVLLARWFVAKRGRAIGIAVTGVSIGGLLFPVLIQGLLNHFEWREALRLVALVILVTAIPAAALIVDKPADRGRHPDGAAGETALMRQQAAETSMSTKDILTNPTFWLAALLFAIVMSGMAGMVTNLVPLAVDHGIEATQAASLIAFYSAGGLLAKLGFAGIADRLNLRFLIVLALAGYASGMACMIHAEAGYPVLALGVTLIGGFGGLMVPMQGFLVPRVFGSNVVGKVSGLMTPVVLVWMLSTPLLFGAAFDRTGSYDIMFWAFIGMSACLLVTIPFMRLGSRSDVMAEAVARHNAG
jgi:MFS family permease